MSFLPDGQFNWVWTNQHWVKFHKFRGRVIWSRLEKITRSCLLGFKTSTRRDNRFLLNRLDINIRDLVFSSSWLTQNVSNANHVTGVLSQGAISTSIRFEVEKLKNISTSIFQRFSIGVEKTSKKRWKNRRRRRLFDVESTSKFRHCPLGYNCSVK